MQNHCHFIQLCSQRHISLTGNSQKLGQVILPALPAHTPNPTPSPELLWHSARGTQTSQETPTNSPLLTTPQHLKPGLLS